MRRKLFKNINKISSSADGTINANTVCTQKSKSNKNTLITKFLLPFTFYYFLKVFRQIMEQQRYKLTQLETRKKIQNRTVSYLPVSKYILCYFKILYKLQLQTEYNVLKFKMVFCYFLFLFSSPLPPLQETLPHIFITFFQKDFGSYFETPCLGD